MATSVLIPWRSGCPHREAALRWVIPQYPWPVFAGCPAGEEWCKAEAVGYALDITDADVLVIADADVWCDETPAAVEAVEQGAPWAVPHISVRRLSKAATADVLAGSPPTALHALDEPAYRAHIGGGIVVLRRDVYEACPLDTRFVGWGREDDSWGEALRCLYGRPRQGTGQLWHLWHPSQPRTDRKHGSDESEALYQRYLYARHQPARMTQLIEETR